MEPTSTEQKDVADIFSLDSVSDGPEVISDEAAKEVEATIAAERKRDLVVLPQAPIPEEFHALAEYEAGVEGVKKARLIDMGELEILADRQVHKKHEAEMTHKVHVTAVLDYAPTMAPQAVFKMDNYLINFFETECNQGMYRHLKRGFKMQRCRQLCKPQGVNYADADQVIAREWEEIDKQLMAGHMILGLWSMLGYCGLTE